MTTKKKKKPSPPTDDAQGTLPLDNGNTEQEKAPPHLGTDDIVRFLKRQAKLYEDRVTGNPAMADALSALARAMETHRKEPFYDIVARLASKELWKPTLTLPENLPDLPLAAVKELITQDFTKSHLIEIAHARFGIPKGGLGRKSKKKVIATIQSALDNEESLQIISEQARLSGTKRSS